MTFAIKAYGGPTVEFRYGDLTVLTDPTFDAPGDYPIGDRALTKTAPASGPPGPVDLVLLSHDEHPDNLDRSGRELLATVPLVLSTPGAAERIGAPVRGLADWESAEVGAVRVTAVPAQHGPDGVLHLTGAVAGFVLEGAGLPTVYVSGDNASLRVVEEIAGRFPDVDVAILFGGAAKTALVGDATLTLTAAEMADAARILGVSEVHAAHVDSWAHFTEGIDDVREAFAAAGLSGLLTTA
jgi:L-ascorbate metabolism protein UlaG (beta-lactamase superfamily)